MPDSIECYPYSKRFAEMPSSREERKKITNRSFVTKVILAVRDQNRIIKISHTFMLRIVRKLLKIKTMRRQLERLWENSHFPKQAQWAHSSSRKGRVKYKDREQVQRRKNTKSFLLFSNKPRESRKKSLEGRNSSESVKMNLEQRS